MGMRLRVLLYWCVCLAICVEINSLNSKDTSLNPIVPIVASSNLHNPAKDESLTNHALFNPSVSVSSQFNALNSASNDILNLIDYDDDDDDTYANDDDDDDDDDDTYADDDVDDDDDDDTYADDDDDDDDDTDADADDDNSLISSNETFTGSPRADKVRDLAQKKKKSVLRAFKSGKKGALEALKARYRNEKKKKGKKKAKAKKRLKLSKRALNDEYRAVKKELKSILKAVNAKIDKVDKSKSKKQWQKKSKDITKGFKKMKENGEDMFEKIKSNVQGKVDLFKGIHSLSDLVKGVAKIKKSGKIDFLQDILNPFKARGLAEKKFSSVLKALEKEKKGALKALERKYQNSKKAKKDRMRRNKDREEIKAEVIDVKNALRQRLKSIKANIGKVDKFDKLTSSKKWKKKFKWTAFRKIIKKGFKQLKVNVRNIFRKVKRNVNANKANVIPKSDLVKDVQNVGFFEDISKPITDSFFGPVSSILK